MNRTPITRLALACALAAALPALAATSGYTESWGSGDGDLHGWSRNTVDAEVSNPGFGGNPGGFLLTRVSSGLPFPIGALTDLPAATGDFSGALWTAKFDVVGGFNADSVSDISLRFRYRDGTFNGWQYSVASALDSNWHSYSVSFDPSWTDAEARAQGWRKDLRTGLGSVAWSETMREVFTTEIRITGSASDYRAGIDNFSLTASAVPEPSSGLLALGGLMMVGGLLKRRA
jgi:hypothetical protein